MARIVAMLLNINSTVKIKTNFTTQIFTIKHLLTYSTVSDHQVAVSALRRV